MLGIIATAVLRQIECTAWWWVRYVSLYPITQLKHLVSTSSLSPLPHESHKMLTHIKLLVHAAARLNGLTSCLSWWGLYLSYCIPIFPYFWVTRWTSNKQAVNTGKSVWQLAKQRVVVVFNLCTFSNQWAKTLHVYIPVGGKESCAHWLLKLLFL